MPPAIPPREDSSKLTQLWRQSGILDRWHEKTFDDFTNDRAAKQHVLNYLARLAEVKKDGVGLYLHGSNGTGKSHLMFCLLKEICKTQSVRAITLGTLISVYTAGWYDKTSSQEFQRMIGQPAFLEVEEIGKEYKSGSSDLGLAVLDSVVRYRLQAMKPILFTTNLTPAQIKTTYSHDIASMLHECALPVLVTGPDKRVEIHQEMRRKYHV